MLLARELPGIEIPELFLPLDIRQAKEMIEKAAFLGFAVCDPSSRIIHYPTANNFSVLNSKWELHMNCVNLAVISIQHCPFTTMHWPPGKVGCLSLAGILSHPLTLAGEPEADMAISKWFLCGHDGVFEKNEELAFKYAERAAAAGLATAEFALGYFYEIGMHVLADLKEAQLWYGKVREYL